MITYTYIVKCPHCEDEFFDFFDEAKEFALSCLSSKPIITQTEVNRNDFGECTDHCDLGTVWSWEDVMKDTCAEDEPAKCIFTKDDLKAYVSDEDPEFASIDNSIDYEIDEISDELNEFVDSRGNKVSITGGTVSTIPSQQAATSQGNTSSTLAQLASKLAMFDTGVSKSINVSTDQAGYNVDAVTIKAPFSRDKMSYGAGFKYKDLFVPAASAISEIFNKTGINFKIDPQQNNSVHRYFPETVRKIWAYIDDKDILLINYPGFNFIIDKNDLINQLSHQAGANSGTYTTEAISIADATRAPKDSDYVIALKHPAENKYTFLGINYKMTSDLNKAMTYSGKFLAEDDTKYVADEIVGSPWYTEGTYYEDRIFVTTVGEAKKLIDDSAEAARQQAAKTASYEARNREVMNLAREMYDRGDYCKSYEEFAAFMTANTDIKPNKDLYYTYYRKALVRYAEERGGIKAQQAVTNRSRKPIPEGMTIEELVEAMEENEDTVECTKCGGLFEKAGCTHNKEGFGWCCNTCEPADTLVEEAQEYDLATLVADSINHLTNDLGKDPWTDDFADDVIGDLERNYETYVPTDFDKYQEWCSAVASEVSRQVNRSEQTSFLEELEDSEAYRKRLELCPECGATNAFDHETGICLNCGFNI